MPPPSVLGSVGLESAWGAWKSLASPDVQSALRMLPPPSATQLTRNVGPTLSQRWANVEPTLALSSARVTYQLGNQRRF